MKRIFVFVIVLTFALISLAASNTNVKKDTLALEVFSWHTLTGEKIKHTIEVSEDSEFSISSTINKKTKWNISGTVGHIVDGAIPINLHVEWERTDAGGSEKSDSKHVVKIGEKAAGSGTVHGVCIMLSVKEDWDLGILTREQGTR